MLDLFGNEIPPIEEAASQNVAPNGASSTSAAPIKQSPAVKLPRTPMDAIEQGILRKLQAHVTFVPASSHKRFIHDLNPDRSQLSDRGRAYLAYIAHRYRRQWKATHEEFCWIVRWASYGTLPRPRPDSQCR
jgi:hypothetical protein